MTVPLAPQTGRPPGRCKPLFSKIPPLWLLPRHCLTARARPERRKSALYRNCRHTKRLPAGGLGAVLWTVCDTLSETWYSEVPCDGISGTCTKCAGKCLFTLSRARGMCLAAQLRGGGRASQRVFEVWEPPITPSWSVREDLLSIFTSDLATCLPWHKTWGGLVPSAMAWVRPALCSDYPRMTVLQALHGSVLVRVLQALSVRSARCPTTCPVREKLV